MSANIFRSITDEERPDAVENLWLDRSGNYFFLLVIRSVPVPAGRGKHFVIKNQVMDEGESD